MRTILYFFANSAEELQQGLDLLSDYCKRWKLKVNASKTKVMIFWKGGRISANLVFYYDGEPIEIVPKFKYLGIVLRLGFHSQKLKTLYQDKRRKQFLK